MFSYASQKSTKTTNASLSPQYEATEQELYGNAFVLDQVSTQSAAETSLLDMVDGSTSHSGGFSVGENDLSVSGSNDLGQAYYDAWIQYWTGVSLAWGQSSREGYQVPDSTMMMPMDEDWRIGMNMAGLGHVDPTVLRQFYHGAQTKEEGQQNAQEEISRLSGERAGASSSIEYQPPWESDAYQDRNKSEENKDYRQ